MTALLALEPRDAGADVVEPVIELQDGFYAEQNRTRCTGCCLNNTRSGDGGRGPRQPGAARPADDPGPVRSEIGRASCRERV